MKYRIYKRKWITTDNPPRQADTIGTIEPVTREDARYAYRVTVNKHDLDIIKTKANACLPNVWLCYSNLQRRWTRHPGKREAIDFAINELINKGFPHE